MSEIDPAWIAAAWPGVLFAGGLLIIAAFMPRAPKKEERE